METQAGFERIIYERITLRLASEFLRDNKQMITETFKNYG